VCIIRADDALIKYRDTFPGGPGAFFADVTQETYVIKYALYVLQTLLADGVVVGHIFISPGPSGLIEVLCLIKDLSLLCCLSICPGHHFTKCIVV
jgi:hypothetical protein